jgi:hypothetical protein
MVEGALGQRQAQADVHQHPAGSAAGGEEHAGSGAIAPWPDAGLGGMSQAGDTVSGECLDKRGV